MSAFSHETFDAQDGAVDDEVIVFHVGCPEREIETTVQFLLAAARHIREPKKPVPPHTTSFFFVGADMFDSISALNQIRISR